MLEDSKGQYLQNYGSPKGIKVALCIIKHGLGSNVEHGFLSTFQLGNSSHTVNFTSLLGGNIEGFITGTDIDYSTSTLT